MIQCQNCRKNNPDGNEYCGHCGSKLVKCAPQPPEIKYPLGKEPEEIKRMLKSFLIELHGEFPDHIIDYSRWNHEKWDKPARYLCKQLEYKSLASMLWAYGFKIKRSSSTNENDQGSDASEKRLSDHKLPQKDCIGKTARKKKSNKKWYVTAGIFAGIILVVCLLMLRSCVNKPQATDVAGEWVVDGILQDGKTIHRTDGYEYCRLNLSEDGIVNYFSDQQDFMLGLYHQNGTDGHGQFLYKILLYSDGEDISLAMIYSPENDSILLLQSGNDGLIFTRYAEKAENQKQSDDYSEDETETTEDNIRHDEAEMYITNCLSGVSTRSMVRYSDQYLGHSYKFVVQVEQIFDDGVLYLITDENNDGFCVDGCIYAKDCRTFDTTKILKGDILIIYGDYSGVSKDDIVCMKVYYSEILSADATVSDLPETSFNHNYPKEIDQLVNAAYNTLTTAEFGSTDFARYCLYDVNGNGIEELIIIAGTCEADAQLLIYEYSNGSFSSVGIGSGSHISICGKTTGNGITVHSGHMGYETIKEINIVNGEMTILTLIEDQEAMEGYTEFDYCIPIEFHSIGDYSLLGIENG